MFVLFCVTAVCAPTVFGHGSMIVPRPRGGLAGIKLYGMDAPAIDEEAPKDYRLHFPAGVKTDVAGAGKRYQQKVGKQYTEFNPMHPKFRWRAGVCGDTVRGGNANDHLSGGKYYYGAKISQIYREGSQISLLVAITANHRGFFRVHICKVEGCPQKDISQTCFNKKNCRELQRAPVSDCERGVSAQCGPIDVHHKGRWYVPCENRINGRQYSIYGLHGEIKYQLPQGLWCDHCVLHFFWTSANNCRPLGTTEYFLGENRPKNWEKCLGKFNMPGSYFSQGKPCKGKVFPEEYHQCSDIRINQRK